MIVDLSKLSVFFKGLTAPSVVYKCLIKLGKSTLVMFIKVFCQREIVAVLCRLESCIYIYIVLPMYIVPCNEETTTDGFQNAMEGFAFLFERNRDIYQDFKLLNYKIECIYM